MADSVIQKPFSGMEDFTSKVTFNDSGYFTGNTYFVKMGNMVFFNYVGGNIVHSTTETVLTIPAGYRPKNAAYILCSLNANYVANMIVKTTGELQFNNYTVSTFPTEARRIYTQGFYRIA